MSRRYKYDKDEFLDILNRLIESEESSGHGCARIYDGFITRNMIKSNRDKVFVFGDNMQRRGYGGQAKVARGEPNTIGLPTKWKPTRDYDAYFRDEDFDKVKPIIDETFDRIEEELARGKEVVFFPNIGKGYAMLNKTAPKIYNYIKKKIDKLINDNPCSLI